ncbi:hypothetical protein DMX11_25145 [Pseudomonas sp. LB-090624]|nr:hypothetical protein DMX11_25145 [Pseudomonas sp. LB-090624]
MRHRRNDSTWPHRCRRRRSHRHALPVAAGSPANQPTRWMARASPVFAGPARSHRDRTRF